MSTFDIYNEAAYLTTSTNRESPDALLRRIAAIALSAAGDVRCATISSISNYIEIIVKSMDDADNNISAARHPIPTMNISTER